MEVKGAFGLGGEVRRLQIIYFLSHRMGRVDHPHLIRVLHLTRNGVYLRGSDQHLSYIYASSFVQVFDTVLCNIWDDVCLMINELLNQFMMMVSIVVVCL